jgi:hypothetical protein
MAIVAGDIEFRLSGGASNNDPNISLGGAKSSVEIVDATLQNLFDNISGAEASAGDTEYRCFYVHNAHATLSLQNAVAWIQTNTPSTSTAINIGAGTAAINATEQTVANESTAPSGVSFSAAANEGAAISLGTIPAGQHKAIWVRRVVDAAAAAYDNDGATIRIKGETAA